MDNEAELIPLEPRPFFLHPLMSYKHRICFDLRDNECLGLVRAIFVGEDDAGCFVEVQVIDEGVSKRAWFRDSEIGYLDYNDAIFITTEELLEDLNELEHAVEVAEQVLGRENYIYEGFKNDYDWLVEDLVQILCINRQYSRHNLQWLQLQHYMAQIPTRTMVEA